MKYDIRFFLVFFIFFLHLGEPKSQTVDYYLNRADKKITKNDIDGAISLLERGKLLFPDEAAILNKIGDCQRKKGDYVTAAKTYALAQAVARKNDSLIMRGVVKASKLFGK